MNDYPSYSGGLKDKRIFIPVLSAISMLLILCMLIKNHQIHCPVCASVSPFSPAVIKHFILGFGAWALIVFIGLYAINIISILPPIGLMSLAAGFIFGPLQGTIAIMVGSLLGTTATFFISRIFGARFVDQLIKGKAKEFQRKLDRNGFKVILLIRLIPLIPGEIVNYASGLSRIRYIDYMGGTLIGILPLVLFQTFFTDRLSTSNFKDAILFKAVGAFLFLAAIPVFYLRNKKSRRRRRV